MTLEQFKQLMEQNNLDVNTLSDLYQALTATGKTPLGLNQWIASDKPTMEDFNRDNEIIDQELRALQADVNTKIDQELRALKADVNTKAEYKSGVWTPLLPSEVSASLARGTYSKVGNRVTIDCVCNTTITTASENTFKISGLPYPANEIAIGCMHMLRVPNSAVTTIYPMAEIGSTDITLTKAVSSGAISSLLFSDVTIGGSQFIRINMTYRTAS